MNLTVVLTIESNVGSILSFKRGWTSNAFDIRIKVDSNSS